MTADALGASLLIASADELQSLLAQALTMPECVRWLLDNAAQNLDSSPTTAIRSAEIAYQLALLQQDHRQAAVASMANANALRALGRHADAANAYDAASSSARQANDAVLAARVQIGKIDSLAWLGRHTEAVSLAKKLLEEFRQLEAPQDAARLLLNLGNVYYRQDRHRDALNCYEEAAGALLESGDPLAAAKVNFNRSNVYSELLEPERALELLGSAREVFDAQNQISIVAMCDSNMGVIYQGGGQYAAALASQQRALRQFTELNQALESAKCGADMAEVYRLLNLQDEALAAYDGAIDVFRQIPLDYERGRAELGRSAVLAAHGRNSEAGEALEQAEEVFRTQRNAAQMAQVRLLRAYRLREMDDLSAARIEAKRAAASYSRLRLPARAAEARFVEADIDLSRGENAVRKMSHVRRTARTYAQGWLETRAERSLGRYRAAQGKMAAALKHFRAGVQALEATRSLVPGEELHTAFISNKLAIYEDIVSLLLSRGRIGDISEALEYVERSKSRLLLERVQSALSGSVASTSGDSGTAGVAVADLRARLNRLYNQIHPEDTDASKRLLASPKEQAERLVELEDAYRSALREAETESGPGLYSLMQVASPDQLRSWLSPDETLIEYYIVHGTICAFVVSKREPVKVARNLASEGEIGRLCRRLRYHLKRAGSAPGYVEQHSAQFLSGVKLPLSRLFDLLVRPIAQWVAGNKVTIVPHGVLHGLPFHGLYDSEAEEYALDRWEIAYSPSATVRYLNNLSNSPRDPLEHTDAPLVMGVPHPGLEQIEVEVAQLATVLPGANVYCGPTATLERFHEHASTAGMIHLATHALFRADNPLFSSLRFANGWLLARDLYSMRLKCDLVTLSACRTGQAQVESGDEMFGLLRGFLSAGARSVAVSLWPAEDAPTARLMTEFHKKMSQGESRTASLRWAQQCVRRTWQHPYQWAAFALFGER